MNAPDRAHLTLYPFLAAGTAAGTAAGNAAGPAAGTAAGTPADGDRIRDAVLDEVRRSTAAKAAQIADLRRRVLDLAADRLVACATDLAAAFAAGGRLYTFGNGGSSTDAAEVATIFLHPPTGRALPALSLTSDVAVLTALSNDIGFDVVFARQVAAFGRRGDIAFGLSTSGGSTNVIRAFEEASRRGMRTVGLAGQPGGAMADLDAIDHLFIVPSPSVHRVQEAQTTLYHVLWELTQWALAAMDQPTATGAG